MKIAMVVPPWIRVPPVGYGGIELVVALLTEGLVKKGHQVTLFTVGESVTDAQKFSIFEHEMRKYLDAQPSNFLNTVLTHTMGSYLEIARNEYDIIHDHTWKEGLCSATFMDTPTVHTLHGPFDEENKRFYSLFIGQPGVYFTTISKFQQSQLSGLNYSGVVYNSIDLDKYTFLSEKEDFCFYLGRFNSEKAPHLACKAAKELGLKLFLAGKISEKDERDYFDEYVKPYICDDIQYMGEISDEEKIKLFSQARGYLFPIQWDEPFGLTMIEALACGTPVVTFKRGSAPEIVEHGKSGFVVETWEEYIQAVKDMDSIDSKACRDRVEGMFTVEAMVNGYESIYNKVLEESKRS